MANPEELIDRDVNNSERENRITKRIRKPTNEKKKNHPIHRNSLMNKSLKS